MTETITINQSRLNYLLKLFDYSSGKLLAELNADRSKKLTQSDVFADDIKLSVLKKIDKYFKQGLNFYTNPQAISAGDDSSVLFRKQSFNADLTLGDRQTVNKIEREVLNLTALSKLAGVSWPTRKLDSVEINQSPQQVAAEMRQILYPSEQFDKDRDFLKALINRLGECNIVVLEFVEARNLKNKASIDGFFLRPNIISIKRQQKSFKREIFTLAHELGHYLLDSESLDQLFRDTDKNNPQTEERWCNTFAFHFLVAHESRNELEKMDIANLSIEQVQNISQQNHISRLALFSHLSMEKKIGWPEYDRLRKDLNNQYEEIQKKEKNRRQLQPQGSGGSQPQPIRSELEKNIFRDAFLSDSIGEYAVLKRFNTKDIDKFVYG